MNDEGVEEKKKNEIFRHEKFRRRLPGIEPGTPCTQSKNHTSRPQTLVDMMKHVLC